MSRERIGEAARVDNLQEKPATVISRTWENVSSVYDSIPKKTRALIAAGGVTLVLIMANAACGESEGTNSTPDVNSTPVESVRPVDIQMPPPLEPGANCARVDEALNDFYEDKNDGPDYWVLVGVHSFPEDRVNAVIVLNTLNQGVFNATRDFVSEEFAKWIDKSDVRDNVKIIFVSGILTDEGILQNIYGDDGLQLIDSNGLPGCTV